MFDFVIILWNARYYIIIMLRPTYRKCFFLFLYLVFTLQYIIVTTWFVFEIVKNILTHHYDHGIIFFLIDFSFYWHIHCIKCRDLLVLNTYDGITDFIIVKTEQEKEKLFLLCAIVIINKYLQLNFKGLYLFNQTNNQFHDRA